MRPNKIVYFDSTVFFLPVKKKKKKSGGLQLVGLRQKALPGCVTCGLCRKKAVFPSLMLTLFHFPLVHSEIIYFESLRYGIHFNC